jgi:trehalose-6-phosphate synthase
MARFYAWWLTALVITALIAAIVQSTIDTRRLTQEARSRLASLAVSLEDSLVSNYNSRRYARIERSQRRLQESQGVQALVLCPAGPRPQGLAVGFPLGAEWERLCSDSRVASLEPGTAKRWSDLTGARPLEFFAQRLESAEPPLNLVSVLDISHVRQHWVEAFARTFLITFFGGLGLLLLMATQLRGWIQSNVKVLHQNLSALLSGKRPSPERLPEELRTISRDLSRLASKIRPLNRAQSRSSLDGVSNADWLSALRRQMGDRKLIVIANREPYIHQRKPDGQIEVVRPASGLVTALEPILRHCGGIWIGHGSGSADHETADAQSEVAVPPSKPTYKLRRVWLSREEEQGYYFGFANEGFWPLCHLAHTRPIFRLSDWQHYQNVNRKFTDAIPEHSLNTDSIVLVQDYHFAMAPRYLRDRLERRNAGSRAKIGLFWHIPWPNPEAFGICPWGSELLRGMLGADVIGFHTQYHCNNFLETCNRYLEARIDLERFSVTMGNHETLVRAFPIGIDTAPVRHLSDAEITQTKARYGITADFVAVGVDRLDYTKGLVERVEAVERFLEKYPQFVGRFTLAQMGSPSRTSIPAYQDLAHRLDAAVTRVNERFGRTNEDGSHYLPVMLLASHHEWEEIQYFYQIGNVCLVTSLHDGMNLVAKEYVWCQRPDRGTLILSRFTGASRELSEAFIVNPYSIEEMADALASALSLAPEERETRMISMRRKVERHNAFHWASEQIGALITKDEGVLLPPATPGLRGKLKSVASISGRSASAMLGGSAKKSKAALFH